MAFIEVNGARFQTVESPSVLTRRNFGLTRGKSLQEAAHLLLTMGPELAPIQEEQDVETAQSGRQKNSVTFGLGGLGDKSSNHWDWPLGEAHVVNTDTTFEATVDVKPFTDKEIYAMVMGTELVLQCKSDDKKRCCNREVVRNYQLPLNLDPMSVRFFFSRDRGRLMITGDKVLPIKLAIAFFSPEYLENEEQVAVRE